MERYVTTTYRSHELHICASGWYVTTTCHLCTNNENNIIYMYEVFSLEILVCWQQAWDVLRFRERLSTSLTDVLRHWLIHDLSCLTHCIHKKSLIMKNFLWTATSGQPGTSFPNCHEWNFQTFAIWIEKLDSVTAMQNLPWAEKVKVRLIK